MKKFISFVMAGAMVASLVPATAFAKGEVTATAKVVDAKDLKKDETVVFDGNDGPELQLKVSSVDYQRTNGVIPELDVTVSLENAEFATYADYAKLAKVTNEDGVDILGTAGEAGTVTTKGTADVAGAYYYLTASAADLSSSQYIKIPTFADKTSTVSVSQQAADYVAQGYELVAAVYDSATGLYTNGTAAKSGETSIDLTTLRPKTVTQSAADQFTAWKAANLKPAEVDWTRGNVETTTTADPATAKIEVVEKTADREKDEITLTFKGYFKKGDIIAIDLESQLTKSSVGTKATVSVDSKAVTADDLVYATIVDKGIKASVKKTVDIAEEEVAKLYSNGIKIESVVGDFVTGQKFELKLSKGFEFSKVNSTATYAFGTIDDNEVAFTYNGGVADEFTIDGDDIEIEATSAKSGAVATLTVKAVATKGDSDTIADTATVEVAKVVDYKVSLSVDEDEDVPVIYSGVNVDNDGITDDSDHLSLEVTAKESFPGAWSMRQGFNFNLPEGVYVTAVKNIDAENFYQGGIVAPDQQDAWTKAFVNAYRDGDHKNFEFDKRVFDDVNTNVTDNDPAELTFQLELVADPTFEGDVKLAFEGPLVEKQEVTIAKFVKPYTVKAEQNDLIIDYRNTEIKTPIVITEAEEGLWEKGAEFTFSFDKDNVMEFEDDATFEIDKDSELDVKDETKNGTLKFTIKEESDAVATVTIKDMKLFMNRNIPAGAYDLEIGTSLGTAYKEQGLFAPDENVTFANRNKDKESFVDDVCDYSDVVKEAFVNVVTSGRDQDNLFTTKVVVPVGEAYLVAGENKVELDVAAYISDAGYTMLPVRAISKALGVNTNNVLWNAEARTVTIMYGQRIITMTVGQKTIYVNGSAIPSSAAPEIKDGRTFLPLRDLGTALGVTDVSWDAATKTATMNGGSK